MTQLVSFVNSDGKVSSKLVAEKFGKQHTHVLRDFKKLSKSLPVDFIASNFGSNNINTLKGTEISEVMMSRDGFSLLAMGFTGKDALEWKVKFINAFNQMENGTAKMLSRLEYLERENQLRLESESAKRQRSERRKGQILGYITNALHSVFDSEIGIIPKTILLPRSEVTESEAAMYERINCSHRLKGVTKEHTKREQWEMSITAWEKLTPDQRLAIPRPEKTSFGL
jgi:Rha family phage regulatory protein